MKNKEEKLKSIALELVPKDNKSKRIKQRQQQQGQLY